MRDQLKTEPTDSIARIYFITALLLHVTDAPTLSELEPKLMFYLNRKANEQLELGIVTGMRGKPEGWALLESLLSHPEADARIGAANGMLRLLK